MSQSGTAAKVRLCLAGTGHLESDREPQQDLLSDPYLGRSVFSSPSAMMMAGGHGHENPNSSYMNQRGFWLFYILILAGAHLILLSVPIDSFSVPWVWTVTNVGHNAISFWVFHWIKSTPWLTFDQGNYTGPLVVVAIYSNRLHLCMPLANPFSLIYHRTVVADIKDLGL